jgi:hypothetical protein
VTLVERLHQPPDVGLVELERLGELVDLGVVQAAKLFAAVEQGGEGAVEGVAGGRHVW